MLLEQLRPDIQSGQEEKLYHKDVGFPSDARLPKNFTGVVRLNYGSHAREEAMADKYGNLKLPAILDIRKCEIIEIGVVGTMITKMVVRTAYSRELDLVIVFIPQTGFVKTVWANKTTDKHTSLNKSRYAVPANKLN